MKGDAAFGVEPGDVSAFGTRDHRVRERLDVHDTFGCAVGIGAVAFGLVIAIVVAEASAGGTVERAGLLGGRLWA